MSSSSLEQVRTYERCAASTFGAVRGKAARQQRMGQQLALERAVLLAKLLANLHVFVEGSCAPELKASLRGGSWAAAPGGVRRQQAAAATLD